MSTAFVASLATTVVVILGIRFLIRALPLRRLAARVSTLDAALVALGVSGLVFHCTAMFFRSTAENLPGAHGTIVTINQMGTASIVWYAIPATLLLIGLRHQHVAALALIAAALTVVGATMYDHGSLRTHLHAIFASGVIIALVVAALVLPPWHTLPARRQEPTPRAR